ncbi:MAG TPA: di-heme oxidoredictase family protein [Polyangiaceae bacterium LLY-WYZ-15_(1-7)]|nr:di-heme oxidoredictase family protein [Polyangiaceae bacterium LLY-WYZ-15_(1-7)]HJL09750.1 di-heme oxidoredictase family protein [Polyangiaceae bacterium LLY-WYZ-15_(1-7)]HJL39270.1 di-heme oxidoredictase family protein [Polyangiaceae bacterium LLY-WYZ-15_(1-7)]
MGITTSSRALALTLTLSALALGCKDDDPVPVADGIFAERFGEPLPSATAEQLEIFRRGEQIATKRFSPADGLGPHFNVTFCGACHEKPTFGGSASHYRDFLLVGQELADGSRVELGVNGVLPQFELSEVESVEMGECLDPRGVPTGEMGAPPGMGPASAVSERRAEDPRANHFANRNPIPFFGVGLLAEIDEAAILANADPEDRDGDGISGRPNLDRGFVGRFGVKSQTVSIEGFIRGPLNNHLGITSNPLSNELRVALPVPSPAEVRPTTRGLSSDDVGGLEQAQAAAPDEPTVDADDVCDPELPEQDLFDLVSWAMLLAPPRPDAPTEESERGRALFEDANCTGCHIPQLESPRGGIPAFSDLLLHDMGPELADGVVMGRAGRTVVEDPNGCPESSGRGCEFRTAPLWGVAATAPFLHDGRADTLDEAIRMHGGEATGARDAYVAMSDEERALVITFLESLGGREQITAGLLPPGSEMPAPGELGGPLRPLDETERALFEAGRLLFDRDTPKGDGLGPGFNGDACRSCHFEPTIGGAGPIDVDVSRQGRIEDGVFTAPEGGTMAHRFLRSGHGRPPFDPTSNVVEARQTPPLFGMGLMEAIPVETIMALADPEDADADGISGRAHVLPDGRLGRFGWKADIPSSAEFTRDAMSMELGLTLPPQEGLTFGLATDDDEVPDPEATVEELEALTFFMAMLAPPARQRRDMAAEDAGEVLFGEVGCASCHATLEAADGTTVPLYSDILLHDVQEEGYEGIVSGDASTREFRTTPLWGLRDTGPYWHDGRAGTIEEAIAAHAGEATAVRMAYEALDGEARAQLLAFLRSL